MDTNSKFIVEPNDDPSAANAEIEIIVSEEIAPNGLIVICTVSTAASVSSGLDKYIGKCIDIAFRKQGYRVNTAQKLLTNRDGKHWVHVVMQKV